MNSRFFCVIKLFFCFYLRQVFLLFLEFISAQAAMIFSLAAYGQNIPLLLSGREIFIRVGCQKFMQLRDSG